MYLPKPITLDGENLPISSLFEPKSKSNDRYSKPKRREYNAYYREVVSKNRNYLKQSALIRIPYFQVPHPVYRPSITYEIVSIGKKYSFLTDKMNREQAIIQLIQYAKKFLKQTDWKIFIDENDSKREFLNSTNPNHNQFIQFLCQ
jgi:hypothetical protein